MTEMSQEQTFILSPHNLINDGRISPFFYFVIVHVRFRFITNLRDNLLKVTGHSNNFFAGFSHVQDLFVI